MSWRESMVPAKFGDASFFVQSSEFGSGRRTVTHEYPLRDQPFVEDLGRKVRSFGVEGFVLGDNYLSDKATLLAALEKEGPQELTHPYWGTRKVICKTVRIRESYDHGGSAQFSLDFEETEAAPVQPLSTPDVKGSTQSAATKLRTHSYAAFAARYNVTRQPPWTLDSLSGALTSGVTSLSHALAPVLQDAQLLASVTAQLTTLTANANALAASPADLVAGLANVFEGLDSAPLGRLGITALLAAYSFDPGTPPAGPTADRMQQLTNFLALQQLFQQLLIVGAAYLAPLQTYTSFEDAVAARNAIAAVLDDQASVTPDDDVYSLLESLRAQLCAALPGASALPHLIQYTSPVTLPSLVVCQQLYGDVSQEADLLARNKVAQPGFLPGGVALEVLSRG